MTGRHTHTTSYTLTLIKVCKQPIVPVFGL